MDVNSKMQLKPGFQLTAESFNKMVDIFSSFLDTAASTVAGGRIGMVPGFDNTVRGAFVRDTFEFEIRNFRALLPSGTILDIDEAGVIQVPLLYGDTYYLTVNMSDDVVEFESEGIPFVRNKYVYAISTFDDMVASCSFPLIRFVVKDGSFSVDDSFMRPCLQAKTEPRIKEYIDKLIDALTLLSKHPNMVKGDMFYAFYHYIFELKTIKLDRLMLQIYGIVLELASALNFYIFTPNQTSPEEVKDFSPYDPEQWLTWLLGYVERASNVLDGVTIEEEKIDLESIKQELRAEIYEHLQPDLERIVNERVENLSEALQTRIEEVLKDYVSGKIRGELHDELRVELDADIRASLYSDLYQALYSVLFVPKEEEDNSFIPLI